jgi:putative hydrolase of the HAD superfamily
VKIFFDVDGVLIDGWHVNAALRKPWNDGLEADLGVNVRDFENVFFVTAEGEQNSIMDSCVMGKRDLKEALQAVLPALGYQGSVDDFVAYWFEKDSNINPDVFDIVSKLKTIPEVELFVATGQEHHRASYLWNQLAFSNHFEKIFYSANIGYLKSSTKFFEVINTELEILEQAPLFFDDSETVVNASIEAGWEGVVFNSVEDLRQHPKISELLSQNY